MLRGLLTIAVALLVFIPQTLGVKAASGYSHIYVIFEENRGYDTIVGNTTDAPYINQLANTYAFAANYYGVTHDSRTNYVSFSSGDWYNDHSDSPVPILDVSNLADQLDAAGKTWSGYMQSYPSVGFTGDGSGLYVLRHNPWMMYKDIQNNPARYVNDKPITALQADLASGKMANLVFIAPDVCHDMHGISVSEATQIGNPECGWPNPPNTIPHALIKQSDDYLKTLVTSIMSSPAWTSDSAIVVTWDEADDIGSNFDFGYDSIAGCCSSPDGQGGGRVPFILISSNAPHTVSVQPYNHYSLLRTVENNFGLPCLRHSCDASVHAMDDVFPPNGQSRPLGPLYGMAVTFTSTVPGTGRVHFGTGPNCTGLIYTATRDLFPGTTTHTVLIQGNDLPGTAGNIGLTPGVTYQYNEVTVTKDGKEVQDNGGNCYTFAIPRP